MATAIMKQKIPETDDVKKSFRRYQKKVPTNGVQHKRGPG